MMSMMKKKEVVGVASLCMLLILLSSSVMFINYFGTTTDFAAPGTVGTSSYSPFQQETTRTKTSYSSSSRTSSITTGRRLKAIHEHSSSRRGISDVNLEDYRPIDPSPSSKAVRPGPIQHGTPLNPYIPNKPPPPSPNHPRLDDNDGNFG